MMDRPGPLAGVVVLDLGQIYNGPYASFLMAMAGATVIKIEPPGGEYLRARSAVGGIDMPFAMLNANKQSVVLNLKEEGDRDLFLQAVREVDIVLENFASGTMDRLGIGWDALSAVNPRLIFASGSGFGRSGPHRDFPAMDITVQAFAGLMSVTGFEDGPPTKCGPALCDFSGGVHLFGATMAALFERERTGKGRLVEVAMQESVYFTLASNLALWQRTGRSFRTGNRHGGFATVPYNVYATSDGHIAITCVNDKHWRALTKVMRQPHLGDDPRFARLKDRVERMDAVDLLVETWARSQTKQGAFDALIEAKVPCAPVRTVEEVANDPHMHERGMLAWVDHPKLGRVPMPNSPLRFDGTPQMELRREPDLDANRQEFMRLVRPG